MKIVKIVSIEELIKTLNVFPNHFIFRGQGNADWELTSSLERIIGKNWSAPKAERFESVSLDRFKSKFHLYDHENIEPRSKLAWLSIMQHYGVPTRLIDFTESPYVALYFALEAYNPNSAKDIAVYAIDYTSVMEQSIQYISKLHSNFKETRESIYRDQDVIFEKIVDCFAYDIAWITEPNQMNARLDRQSGCFLLSLNKGSRIEEVLSSQTYENCELQKIVIDHALYQNIYALLRKMNITSKSIYGDLGGLANSIRMELQVYSLD